MGRRCCLTGVAWQQRLPSVFVVAVVVVVAVVAVVVVVVVVAVVAVVVFVVVLQKALLLMWCASTCHPLSCLSGGLA